MSGFAAVHLESLSRKRWFLPIIFVSLLCRLSLALVTHIQDCFLFSVNCLFHHHFPHSLPYSSFSTLRIVRFSFSFHLNSSNKNCNMHGKENLRVHVANSYLWSSVPDRITYMLVTSLKREFYCYLVHIFTFADKNKKSPCRYISFML